MLDAEQILALIEDRRKDLGLSQAEVSVRAFGRKDNSAIQNIKRGSLPSADKLQALAQALGLEFYFGHKRIGNKQPLSDFSGDMIPHHGLAKCSVQGWGKDQPNRDPLPRPTMIHDPDAFYVSAIGQSMMPDGIHSGDYCLVSPALEIRAEDRIWIMDRGGRTSIKRLTAIDEDFLHLHGWMPIKDGMQANFTDKLSVNYIERAHPVIAVYRGKPGSPYSVVIPDTMHTEPHQIPTTIEHDEFAVVRLLDVQLSAGEGRVTWDETPTSALGFPKQWMRQKGIDPSAASLVWVSGDSMEPTLRAGSMVMINHNRTEPSGRRIYAFRLGDDLRVKRLEILADGQILISSDNPDRPTELISHPKAEQLEIIGEVVWVGSQI